MQGLLRKEKSGEYFDVTLPYVWLEYTQIHTNMFINWQFSPIIQI